MTISVLLFWPPAPGLSANFTFLLDELKNLAVQNPASVFVDDKGNIYIVDTSNNRILRFLRTGEPLPFSFAADYVRNHVLGFDPDKDGIAEPGTNPGQFRQPQGIVVDSQGRIYIVDTANHRIQIFLSTGEFVRSIGSPVIPPGEILARGSTSPGEFSHPRDIALLSDGTLLILDSANHRIQAFTPEGVLKGQFVVNAAQSSVLGGLGLSPGQFDNPYAIAVDGKDRIYVVDTFNNRIQCFDAAGTLLWILTGEETEEGSFLFPKGITLSRNGDIYIADSDRNKIHHFNSTRHLVKSTTLVGNVPGGILYPEKMRTFVSPDVQQEKLYVVDSMSDKVIVLDITEFVSAFSAIPQKFSPNGDGLNDVLTVSYFLQGSAQITALVANDQGVEVIKLIDNLQKTSGPQSVEWDGTVNGQPVAEGRYEVILSANYDPRVVPPVLRQDIVVDRTPPFVEARIDSQFVSRQKQSQVDVFYMVGDNFFAQLKQLTIKLLSQNGAEIRTIKEQDFITPGSYVATWDLKDATGLSIADGNYQIVIQVEDEAGNVSKQTIPITIDSTSPTFQSAAVSPSVLNAAIEGFSFDVVASELVLIDLEIQKLSAGEKVTRTFQFTPQQSIQPVFIWNGRLVEDMDLIDDGNYQFKIRARDMAGNMSVLQDLGTFAIDRTPALVTQVITLPNLFTPDGDGQNDEVLITYRIDATSEATTLDVIDPKGAIKIQIDLGQRLAGTHTFPNQGGWAPIFDWKVPTLLDGTYTFRITTTDQAGNRHSNSSGSIRNRRPTEITFPLQNQVVSSAIIIKGTAVDPSLTDLNDFKQYRLFVRAGLITNVDLTPAALASWQPVAVPFDRREVVTGVLGAPNLSVVPVLTSQLGYLDTLQLPDGDYTLLLIAEDNANPANVDFQTRFIHVDNTPPVPLAVTLTLDVGQTASTIDPLKDNQINITYEVSGKTSDVNIYIFDEGPTPGERGKIVRILRRRNINNVRETVFWDGKDFLGQFVPTGTYFIVGEAVASDGIGRSETQGQIAVTLLSTAPLTASLSVAPSILLLNGVDKTNIQYQISEEAEVTIDVLQTGNPPTSAGFILGTSAGGVIKPKGTFGINWDGGGLTPGLYEIQMKAVATDAADQTAPSGVTVKSPITLANQINPASITAQITAPSPSENLKGLANFRWEAGGTGKQFPQRSFNTTVQAGGTLSTFPPQQLNWTVQAKATESFNFSRSSNVNATFIGFPANTMSLFVPGSGQVTLTFFGDPNIQTGSCCGAPSNLPVFETVEIYPTEADALVGSFPTFSQRILVDGRQLLINGSTFTINRGQSYFLIASIFGDAPSNYRAYRVEGTAQNELQAQNSNSSVVQVFPDGQPTQGDLGVSITFAPLNGGTISNPQIIFPPAGQDFDDNPKIQTSLINPTFGGNTFSGTIKVSMVDFDWSLGLSITEDFLITSVSQINTLTVSGADPSLVDAHQRATLFVSGSGPMTVTLRGNPWPTVNTPEARIVDIFNNLQEILNRAPPIGSLTDGQSIQLNRNQQYVFVSRFTTKLSNTQLLNQSVPFRLEVPQTTTLRGAASGSGQAFSPSVRIPFSINFSSIPGFVLGGTLNLSTLKIDPPANGVDFDNNTNVRTGVANFSVDGSSLRGEIVAENIFTPIVSPWPVPNVTPTSEFRKTFTGTVNALQPFQSNELAQEFPVSKFVTLNFDLFTVTENNPNVTAQIERTTGGGKLVVRANDQGITWTTADDPLLNNAIMSPFAVFNNAEFEFRDKSNLIVISSAYPTNFGTAINSDLTLFKLQNGILVDNPLVQVNSWNIQLFYPDGAPTNDFEIIQPIQITPENNLMDNFRLKLKLDATPKLFVQIMGTAASTAPGFFYDLLFRKAGETNFKTISRSFTPVTNGILGFWDITGLEGQHEFLLRVKDNNGVAEAMHTLRLGEPVKVADNTIENLVVSSPLNRARIQFDQNSLSQEFVVSVTPVTLATVASKQIVPPIAPLGPIVDLQPENIAINPNNPAKLTYTFSFEEMQQLAVRPEELSIYNLKDNGQLEIIGNKEINFLDPNQNGIFDVGDFVEITATITHFSLFTILKNTPTPRFDPVAEITAETDLTITGLSVPGARIVLLQNRTFEHVTFADALGQFKFTVSLSPGKNTFSGTAFTVAVIPSEPTEEFSIIFDAISPQILAFDVEPKKISPNQDGIADQANITFIVPENNLKIRLDILNGVNQVVHTLPVAEILPIGEVSVSWDGKTNAGTVLPANLYRVQLTFKDLAGNTSIRTIELEIVADDLPPITNVVFEGPIHSSNAQTFITSNTVIRFIAADQGGGKVLRTLFQLDGGTLSVGNNITLIPDGAHTVGFFSEDVSGNREPTKTIALIVDNAPPITSVQITQDRLQGANIQFGATDSQSGVRETQFAIDNGVFQPFTQTIGVQSGKHTLRFFSVDNVGNPESVKTQIFTVDPDPPVTSVVLVGPQVTAGTDRVITSKTTISFQSVDDLTSVEKTEFSIDGAPFQLFVSPVTIPQEGRHILTFRSTDVSGNVEQDRTANLIVDNSAPLSNVEVGNPKIEGHLVKIIPTTPITIVSTDAFSAVDRIDFKIDNGSFAVFQTPFQISQTGFHTISFRATDRLGNQESQQFFTVVVDTTPPSAHVVFVNHTFQVNDVIIVSEHTGLNIPSATIPGNRVEIRPNAGTFVPFTPSITIGDLGLNSGENTLDVKVTNGLGITQIKTFPFTLDKTPPLVVNETKFNNVDENGNVIIQFSVTDDFDVRPTVTAFLRLVGSTDTIPITNRQSLNVLPISAVQVEIVIHAKDFVENSVVFNGGATDLIKDILAPRTTFRINGLFFVEDGETFITSAATISLSAIDDLNIVGDGIGLGVAKIFHRVDDRPFFEVPGAKFDLPGDAFGLDGKHIIQFFGRDALGRLEDSQIREITLDNTPPVTQDDYDSDGVWTNQLPIITLTAKDPLSGVKEINYQIDAGPIVTTVQNPVIINSPVLNQEGTHQLIYWSVDRLANEEAKNTIQSIQLDLTDPFIAVTGRTPEPNKQGWNNTPVVISINAGDALSGLDVTKLPEEANIVSTEGANQSVTRTVFDLAGNHASVTVTNINIDLTPPFFEIFTPSGGEVFVAKKDKILIRVSAKDNLDPSPQVFAQLIKTPGGVGFQVFDGQSIEPLSIPAGQWKLFATATDVAGNKSQIASGEFTIIHDIQPPRTTLTVGDLKFVASDGATYVTATTPLNLSAADDLVEVGDSIGLGVAEIKARADNGNFVTVSGPVTLGGLGVTTEGKHVLSFFARDVLDNIENQNDVTLYVDLTAPVTDSSHNPAPNTNGWNNTDVTVSLSARDPVLADGLRAGSGVKETRIGVDGATPSAGVTATLTTQAIHAVDFYSVDNMTNVEATKQTLVRIDKTAPTISGSQSPPANLHGWNNTPVAIQFAVNDDFSGVDEAVGGFGTDTLTKEGFEQSVTRSVTDKAGNITDTTYAGVDIDSTPARMFVASRLPAANQNGWNNSAVTVTYSGTDLLSGIDENLSDFAPDAFPNEETGAVAAAVMVDMAGNTTTIEVPDIRIDLTNPLISIASVTPSTGTGPDLRTWWNVPVTVTYGVSDTWSGVDFAVGGFADDVLPNEGENLDTRGDVTDNAGNSSSVTKTGINIDLTVPFTSITVGTPRVFDPTETYVTSATQFTLTAQDTLSGVAKTEYRIDAPSTFTPYSPFTLSATEGDRTIGFKSTDYAANEESERTVTIIVDNTPPVTVYSVDVKDTGGNVLIPESLISLTAVDGGAKPVGVATIEYRFDGGSLVHAATSSSTTFGVDNLSLGTHTLEFRAIDRLGTEESFTTFPFTISPALEASKFESFAPRVLVWINDKEHHDADDDDDDEGEEDSGEDEDDGDDDENEADTFPAENVAVIKSILDSASILLYDIVEHPDTFVAMMRTDSYNLYLIIGDENHLDEKEEWELSERVRMGDGLISSFFEKIYKPVHDKGEHEGQDDDEKGKGKGKDDDGDDEDDQSKQTKASKNLLGVEVNGKHGDKNLNITFAGTTTITSGIANYQTVDETKRVRALDPAAASDGLITPKGKDKEPEPSVVAHAFGSGKTTFFAFNLGLSATPLNAQQTEILLRSALRFVTPTKEIHIPDGRTAIGITVKSLVVPLNLSVSVDEQVKDGGSVVNGLGGTVIPPDRVSWNLTLNVNETDTVYYVLGLVDAGEKSVTTNAKIQYLKGPTYFTHPPFDDLALTIVTEKDLPTLLDQATAQFNALKLDDDDGEDEVEDAVEELQKQRTLPPVTKDKIEDALEEVLEIIKDMDEIEADQASLDAIRDTLDKVVLIYARQISKQAGG